MPYKLGLTGKHKLTGDLATWVETFRRYFTADFPPGTLPERPNLAFESYLAVMASFLARASRTHLPDGAAKTEMSVRLSLLTDASSQDDDHYMDLAMYKLLDWIVNCVPAEILAKETNNLRNLIFSKREQIFLSN